MMKLIGISGKRGSGKTLLSKKLEKYGFMKMSLAGPLKQMCKLLYVLTDEELYGKDKEKVTKYGITAREILIREGCLKRSIDKDFWCKQLRMNQRFYHADVTKIVVDDIRFKNEIEYLKREYPGAKFVRLERETGQIVLDDPSENELDNYIGWDGLLLPEFNKNERDMEIYAEYIASHV